MKEYLVVGAGGFLGANARYLVSSFLARHVSASLPWGTLAVNVTGSFLLGAVVIWTTERVMVDPAYRLLLAVGFCGAFTTFSSYGVETVRLMEEGHAWLAVGNFLGNNVLSLLAALAGVALARWV